MRSLLVPILSALLAAPLLAAEQPASAPASDAQPAISARPVHKLYVDVPPYYFSGDKLNSPAKVNVDPDWDKLLSSANRNDIRRAEEGIGANPGLVKPQTLLALAMRLYDVDLRDDAVFWYYVGRSRFLTMQAVLDMRSLQLVRSAAIVQSFINATEPAMDGYAMCSVARQEEIERRAIDWVAAHPYKLLGYTELPAVADDRNAALAAAIQALRDDLQRETTALADPKMLAALQERRAATHDHERFCW
ncbi:hypothetical protein [Scleromatobacter humisilvae]|uniref:Uncharacterized protein n=1 Tax=Scleromatobacter humisilvae TaxID=2897159 RepID=A0A9X1YK97_9BURK|nr:hypothetical protein [Scleromatobacter humisilvae]MCK9687461.1 hypothetical protein [Scleromatobacter humisilvae]